MRHRDDTICNLSACVCDGSLGTHEFCAFNFILKIGCDTSQEATEQFGQAMEVKEAFLGCWSRLRLDFLAFAFGYAGVVVLPSNMVDVGLRQMVFLVVGGCYKPLCDTLLQPLTLTSYCQSLVTPGHAEALRHRLDDA